MAEYTRAEILRRIALMGRLNLSGSDLAGLDLGGLTLVGADLSYADLTGADLTDAQLSDANLWSAQAAGARFRNADLSGANLGLADLSDADLRGAVLERADLTGARLDRADLSEARLRDVWLDAMQRALAIGAPPLRYPPKRPATTHIIDEDHMVAPVVLRCGDWLEMHLRSLTPTTAHRPGMLRVEGTPVLSGPDLARTGPDTEVPVLVFAAVAPGRARLVLDPGEGRAALVLEILVTP